MGSSANAKLAHTSATAAHKPHEKPFPFICIL
jgi:hypothetical protein